jgi:hypothetical protein
LGHGGCSFGLRFAWLCFSAFLPRKSERARREISAGWIAKGRKAEIRKKTEQGRGSYRGNEEEASCGKARIEASCTAPFVGTSNGATRDCLLGGEVARGCECGCGG